MMTGVGVDRFQTRSRPLPRPRADIARPAPPGWRPRFFGRLRSGPAQLKFQKVPCHERALTPRANASAAERQRHSFPAIFFAIFVAQARLPIGQIDLPAIDVGRFDSASGKSSGSPFVTMRVAALPASSEPRRSSTPSKLRRIKRDRFQRFLFRQTERRRHGRFVGKIAFVRGFGFAAVGRDAKAHAGCVQTRGVGERAVVGVTAARRQRGASEATITGVSLSFNCAAMRQASRPPTSVNFNLRFLRPGERGFDLRDGIRVDEKRQRALHHRHHRFPAQIGFETRARRSFARLRVGARDLEGVANFASAPCRCPSADLPAFSARADRDRSPGLGQRKCIAAGARTVISSGVQPSMRMTAD